MPSPIWILLANGSRARLVQRNAEHEELTELRQWTHPETRLHPHEGRGPDRQSGIRGRSALASHGKAEDKERHAFAQEMCEWLKQALDDHAVGGIAFLASNPFLGQLMACSTGKLRIRLTATHAVDLTDLPMVELEQRLRERYRL
jgi:protein required for attachment to host cells